MTRYWTADFHLGFELLLDSNQVGKERRPFDTVEQMNSALLFQCVQQVQPDDVIVHLGDFASKGNDRGHKGLDFNPQTIVSKIPATFVNIRGNHDSSNNVKWLCESMRTNLGRRFPTVSCSHYPTYDHRCVGHFQKGDIHLCGHVHKKWRHCLDVTNQCLNINVGVDVWNYKLVSEDNLIKYINTVLQLSPDKLNRVIVENGKVIKQ